MEPTEVAYDICRYYLNDLEDVDPALIQKVDGFRRSKNLAGLTSCSCHFDCACHSVRDWQFLRQVEAFFKKNASLSNKDKCKEAAKDSFFESEADCHFTNIRLKAFVKNKALLTPDLHKKVRVMESYISKVLGDFHSFLDKVPSLVRVTPGATACSNRRESLPQLKLKLKPFVTRKATALLRSVYHLFGFPNVRVKITHTNRVELVPKNWKTDRTIACEPEGNLPLQLAFDTYAKRRLKMFGIDLRDQSANQKRAKHASIHNDFVTVDFSKASDTISYNTVSLVFPIDWFSYLDKVRTPAYRGVFGDGTYAKFSSMGNGSTFTIETLLFAAACHACGSRKFLVYGDDVIIEKEFYEDFLALTRFLGFTINVDKSFHDGPFRESCGKDYFNGIDVTPIYIRNVDKRKASLCHLINSIASIALPGGSLESFLLNLVKENKLPLVPYNESTLSGIWILPDKARALGILRTKYYCDTFRAYIPKYKRRYFVDSRGYYLWFLNKNAQVLFSGPWELSPCSRHSETSTQTSSAAVYEHVYVRKRVCWREPTESLPDHLYLWSELL